MGITCTSPLFLSLCNTRFFVIFAIYDKMWNSYSDSRGEAQKLPFFGKQPKSFFIWKIERQVKWAAMIKSHFWAAHDPKVFLLSLTLQKLVPLSIYEMLGFFKTPWTCRREMLFPLTPRHNFTCSNNN